MLVRILFLLSLFISINAYSGSRDEYELNRQIVADQQNKKVYGILDRVVQATEKDNFEKVLRKSIAVDVPSASKVGTPMLQRIKHVAKTPGVQMVGAYAVMQLIEAIGWVMEDGMYVKKIPDEDGTDPNYIYDCIYGGNGDSIRICGQRAIDSQEGSFKGTVSIVKCEKLVCRFKYSSGYESTYSVAKQKIPRPKPVEPQTKTVPLTAPLLGAAMLGTSYKDPDPNFNNDLVNTGDYTGVKEAYEHDPSGVGDQLADAMDDKLKNAKPTSDGKASYIGDPKYDERPLTDGDTSSDRAWDSDAGQAEGESKPQTDPDTGEQTGGQSISIKFPVFCEWASSMCKWYDDWSVFTKDENLEKSEDDQVDIEIPEEQELDDSIFSTNEQCPPDLVISYTLLQTHQITYSYQNMCNAFTVARPVVIFIGGLIALFILGGYRSSE